MSGGRFGVDHLRSHIHSLLAFFEYAAVKDESGGFFNQLCDDGKIYDKKTKHVVGTCRFAVNFALASRVQVETPGAPGVRKNRVNKYRGVCAHGIEFLTINHLDWKGATPITHGGFAWVVADGDVVDGTKNCYAVAFALLAMAHAKLCGIEHME